MGLTILYESFVNLAFKGPGQLSPRLRPPEVVVRMACDQGFFFALDYRKGVEIW